MSIDELYEKLERIRAHQECDHPDPETDHHEADDALLEYINDARVTQLFGCIDKWYS